MNAVQKNGTATQCAGSPTNQGQPAPDTLPADRLSSESATPSTDTLPADILPPTSHSHGASSFHSSKETGDDCAKSPKNLKEEETCKVCYDAKINSVLIRCGHMAVCMECSQQLEKCPICRKEIIDVIQIYKV